jgi:outer membrane protein
VAESQLFDLRAQLANDELSLVNSENNLESAKLQLKQLMNLAGSETIDVRAIDAPDPALRAYESTVNEVFEIALQNLPQMEAAKLRVQSAGAAIEIAKAQGLPSLTVNGGINTQFSSAAPKTRFVGDGGEGKTEQIVSQTRFVVVGDQTLPITEVVKIPGGNLETFNYFDQLNFNRNSSVQLNLRVPIFTNYQTKYRVANARIQQQNLEQQANIVTQQIRQNVEQAYIDMSNAAKRYRQPGAGLAGSLPRGRKPFRGRSHQLGGVQHRQGQP